MSKRGYQLFGEFHEVVAFRQPKGVHHITDHREMFIDSRSMWLMFKDYGGSKVKARLVFTLRGATNPLEVSRTVINFACIDPTNAECYLVHNKSRSLEKAKIILHLTQRISARREKLEKISIKMKREDLEKVESLFTILMDMVNQCNHRILPAGWYDAVEDEDDE